MKGIWLGFIAGLIALATFLYTSHAYINSPSVIFLGGIANASSVLAQVFGVVGLAWMLIYSILSTELSKVKLIGSGLVLSLAFAANNVWTYGLSIFVVATLVTELQFLEKLAAMFTNRDKYWEYLAQKSTPEQTVQKAALEAVEDVQAEETGGDVSVNDSDVDLAKDPKSSPVLGGEQDAEPQPSTASVTIQGPEGAPRENEVGVAKPSVPPPVKAPGRSSIGSLIKEIIQFQHLALDALRDYTSMLTGSSLLVNMRYSAQNVSFEVDAILKTESIDYVVEVKNTVSPAVLLSAVAKTQNLAGLYRNLISAAGERKAVKGVLIVPKGVWQNNRFGSTELVVLELDQELRKLKHVDGEWY